MRKADFPLFIEQPELVYLDSAATTPKPRVVIEAVTATLTAYGPVGRALYPLGVNATEQYETARVTLHDFLGNPNGHVIFTAGATDALNTLAHGLVGQLQPGDEIILSEAEHHANLIPWQQVARLTGARVLFVAPRADGSLDPTQVGERLSERTAVVSLSLVSNVYGTITPASKIAELMKSRQGRRPWFVLDASQAAAHLPLSPKLLGCDALIFGGHKMYGPSGIGVLWGSEPLLTSLAPYRTGGGMVRRVSLDEAEWGPLPTRLEAGSPNLEGVVGLATATIYLQSVGWDSIARHTAELSNALTTGLADIPGVSVLGNPEPQAGLISFVHTDIHPHDLAQFLADRQVCVRAGHHCAQPLHTRLNLAGSVRASIGLYNEPADITRFLSAVHEAVNFFRRG
jgi:cysteine desulfurase / selenocysteine lyase